MRSRCASDMQGEAPQAAVLVRSRERFVANLCGRLQPAAHVGCTDAPYTRERLATGQLLHAALIKRSGVGVVGFDIDNEGLEALRAEFPGARLVCADISKNVPREHVGAYNLVVAGEVLEHVRDAGAFLDGCRALLRLGGEVCVTVPNACCPKIGVRSLVGIEVVHPDHFVYYGPRTLRRTMVDAGFEVEMLATYFANVGALGKLANHGLRLSHRFFEGAVGDGLICVARRR